MFFPQAVANPAYNAGMVWSKDGFCRSFNREADGTSNANAGACFLLKPLDQVDVAGGEFVHAVITGCGDNNDGYEKMGWNTVSLDGQVRVIETALKDSRVSAATVGGAGGVSSTSTSAPFYVECHGTGTKQGDPVELDALWRAYGKPLTSTSNRVRDLAVGSMKANIGHANTA